MLKSVVSMSIGRLNGQNKVKVQVDKPKYEARGVVGEDEKSEQIKSTRENLKLTGGKWG